MFANMSPGAIGISSTIDETFDLAVATGFKGVDLDLKGVAEYGVDRVKERCAETCVRLGGWGLPVDYQADDDTFEKGLKELPHLAALAEQTGCTRFNTWMFSGSNELTFADNFDRMQKRLQKVGAILKDHGCALGLEFLGPKTIRDDFKHEFIHTLPGMIELCDAIGTGNMGLLLDCWHWYTSGGSLADITALRAEQVVYVHVNDAPEGVALEDHIDNERAMPMETGVIDLPGFLKALDKIGYDGPITPEPFNDDLAAMKPIDAATTTADCMKKAWSAVGMTW